MLLLKVFVIFLIPFWLFIPSIDAEVLQVDSDFDGKMDQWHHMSNDNKIIKIEYDKNNDNNVDQVDIYEMGDDAADLYEAMLEEFGAKGTPSRRSLSKLNRILQDENVGFFVYGTLTLGQKERDKSTGNVVTAASISGAVYDLTGKRAKIISSISPQVVKGFGSTQEISKEMALSNSSKQSADILINILNNRGIQ